MLGNPKERTAEALQILEGSLLKALDIVRDAQEDPTLAWEVCSILCIIHKRFELWQSNNPELLIDPLEREMKELRRKGWEDTPFAVSQILDRAKKDPILRDKLAAFLRVMGADSDQEKEIITMPAQQAELPKKKAVRKKLR